MRVLIISDIHANLTALEAVLEDAGSFQAVWCLGDLVGYGPDPNECIDRVRSLPNIQCLIGNHDQAALGTIPLSRFNYDARETASWTRERLTEENKQFLQSLQAQSQDGKFTMAHGSPREPIWEYVTDAFSAERSFASFETAYCLVGHAHIPLIFHKPPDEEYVVPIEIPVGETLTLAPRMIINPGSVGQPRDFDPRAAYALLDLEANTWEARRVSYDVTEVQIRILQADLPERQALRLVTGW